MERLAFTQKGIASDQRHPWDRGGHVSPGDFVLVQFGALADKEGFIKIVTDSHNIVVSETKKDPSQPPFIVQGQLIDVGVQSVSKFLMTIIDPPKLILIRQRLPLPPSILSVMTVFSCTTSSK